MSFEPVGIHSVSSVDRMTLHRCVPPLLHLLLGLENDTCSKFKEWIAQRIEHTRDEERWVQIMSLVSDVNHGKAWVNFEKIDNELSVLRDERIDMNNKLKVRGTLEECKKSLRQQKIPSVKLINDKLILKSETEANLKAVKISFNEYKAAETAAKNDN